MARRKSNDDAKQLTIFDVLEPAAKKEAKPAQDPRIGDGIVRVETDPLNPGKYQVSIGGERHVYALTKAEAKKVEARYKKDCPSPDRIHEQAGDLTRMDQAHADLIRAKNDDQGRAERIIDADGMERPRLNGVPDFNFNICRGCYGYKNAKA